MLFQSSSKIKDMDTLHAPGYANMELDQLQQKLDSCKAKDNAYTKGIK